MVPRWAVSRVQRHRQWVERKALVPQAWLGIGKGRRWVRFASCRTDLGGRKLMFVAGVGVVGSLLKAFFLALLNREVFLGASAGAGVFAAGSARSIIASDFVGTSGC